MKKFKFTIEIPSDNYSYALPLTDVAGFTHNFTVDWGDGTKSQVTAYNDPNRIKIYQFADTYTVKITGQCPGFSLYFNENLEPELYISIDSWGDVGFKELDFHGCCNLENLPNNSEGLSTIESFECFLGACSNLTSIPENLFKHNLEAKYFNNCFYNCYRLTSIPENLFEHNTEASCFNHCFYNCSSLTSIPENLFKHNTKATDFTECFYNCSGLTSIPENLFKHNLEAINFERCFDNCSNLISIPEDLFPKK